MAIARWILLLVLLGIARTSGAADDLQTVAYTGDGSDLQAVLDQAAVGSVVNCDSKRLTIAWPVTIRKAMTLRGLRAALPPGLGKTSLVVVEAPSVAILDCEFHGNYDSVSQKDRAPLVSIQQGDFKVERCSFFDGSKDGVNVTPAAGGAGKDIVGGSIRDLKAYRMGRDVVSISGGNSGLRVRKVSVDNVRLERGYHRGAVEVSDGSDNVTVRNVYAQDAVYAIDVQDHGKGSAANTNITIENVEAVRCKHILRTANSPRGHAHLTLRNFSGRECALPLQISHTKNVLVEQLTIERHTDKKLPPIRLEKCEDVVLRNVTIQSSDFADKPVHDRNSERVEIHGLVATQ